MTAWVSLPGCFSGDNVAGWSAARGRMPVVASGMEGVPADSFRPPANRFLMKQSPLHGFVGLLWSVAQIRVPLFGHVAGSFTL